MDLGDVMNELGNALGTITDSALNVYAYHASRITAPAASVGLPESIEYDVTMLNGCQRITFPVSLLVGQITSDIALANLEKYCDGADDSTTGVKAALENFSYTSCHSVRVASAEFSVMTVNGVDYLGATFTVDVIG